MVGPPRCGGPRSPAERGLSHRSAMTLLRLDDVGPAYTFDETSPTLNFDRSRICNVHTIVEKSFARWTRYFFQSHQQMVSNMFSSTVAPTGRLNNSMEE
jgi:hypothetical protein